MGCSLTLERWETFVANAHLPWIGFEISKIFKIVGCGFCVNCINIWLLLIKPCIRSRWAPLCPMIGISITFFPMSLRLDKTLFSSANLCKYHLPLGAQKAMINTTLFLLAREFWVSSAKSSGKATSIERRGDRRSSNPLKSSKSDDRVIRNCTKRVSC